MENDLLKLLDRVKDEITVFKRTVATLPKRPEAQILPNHLTRISKSIENFRKQKPTILPPVQLQSPTTMARSNSFTSLPAARNSIQSLMHAEREQRVLHNPKTEWHKTQVKTRYNLPKAMPGGRRVVGQKSRGKLRKAAMGKPRVLPKEYRQDPLKDPPPITESDIAKGMINLANTGFIPRDVDMTAAFTRGIPPLLFKQADIHEFEDKKIPPREFPLYNYREALALQEHQDEFYDTPAEIEPEPTPPEQMQIVAVPEKMVEPIKSYNDLMDDYALHIIQIRKGKLLDMEPEFNAFKRIYLFKWNAICRLLKQIEEFFDLYAVPLAYIDGGKLAALADIEMEKYGKD